MIGAYREYLALAKRVGVALDARFLIQPFALRYPDGFRMVAARAPAPLHLAYALVFARGLAFSDRLAMVAVVRAMATRRWTIENDCAASPCSNQAPGPARSSALWRPLALAALNIRLPERLRRSLLQRAARFARPSAAASQFWLPRADLSALLPDAVERYVVAARRGSSPRCETVIGSNATPCRHALLGSARGRSKSMPSSALPPHGAVDLLDSAAQPVLNTTFDALARSEPSRSTPST